MKLIQGESSKAGAIMLGSSENYANKPNMNFYIGYDATPKVSIFNNGTVNVRSGLQFNKETNASSGAISWYRLNYKAWTTYMAQAGTSTNGVNGNITAPTGTIVTSWALRSFIEDVPGYGWTWEVGASGTNPTGTVMELSSDTGQLQLSNLVGTGTRMVTSDSTGVLGTTTEVTSDIYTPTVTIGTGTATPSGFTYMQINKIVNVSGLIDCSGILSGVNNLKVTIPVPSSFTSDKQLTGANGSSTGNTLTLQKAGSDQLTVNSSGGVKVNSLAGSGTRMVTADSTGALSSTTVVESSTYTPTFSGSATFYSPGSFKYSRIGEIVHVSGRIGVTGATLGYNSVAVSIPIPSNFTDIADATGTVSGIAIGAPTTNLEGNCVTTYFGTANYVNVLYIAVDTDVTILAEFTYIIK